jgi:hypothetical protein
VLRPGGSAGGNLHARHAVGKDVDMDWFFVQMTVDF